MAEVTATGRLVLDTGGLLAYAEQDRRARAAVAMALLRNMRVLVPAIVLTQCIRGGPRDAPLNRALREH